MPVTLRAGRPEEADAILALWREADAEPTHTDDLASVTKLLQHDPAALIVADEDGILVGSVIAGWDGWRGGIYRLVVTPRHRRRGLARRLLDAAQQRLDERGAVRASAIVVESDAQAMGFWRSTTWDEQTERIRFVKG
jgi:ribosomal protein S18 acetylase RimI-like enzyme